VRVIGGTLRGSRLAVPVVPGLRPTLGRLRQTLFDWLAPEISGARVLDAFAGTGALGIEALSRGAAGALFFECDGRRARTIEADLERLGQRGGRVECRDSLRTLATPASQVFDIVFVDPPFGSGWWTKALSLLDANGWLAPTAWVYVESGLVDPWSAPSHWSVHRRRATGAVQATLLRAGRSRIA
jgi:16S rRNA (guanine966-N2)-methyltransferase